MQVEHEDFIATAEHYFNNANTEQRVAFLRELYNCNTGEVDNVSWQEALDRFEDTRSEQEVNDMLVAFKQLGLQLHTWSDEDECYTF